MVTTVAAMVEGKYINWEGALAFDTDGSKSLELLNQLNSIRVEKYRGDRKYSPVVLTGEGHIQGAVMWSDIPNEVRQLGDSQGEPEKQGGARLRVMSCERETNQVAQETETSEIVPQMVDRVL